MELNRLTIAQARDLLDRGEISAQALASACLAAIKEQDEKIQACLSVLADEALQSAAQADVRLQAGERAPLLGIPYLAKDNIMARGFKTTAASKMLADYESPYDATVISRLKEGGAVLLGKTNLDEFAHGASTENSAFKTTRNPHDLERVPGGSSGGSAAAVAAHMCLFALGSDTGGSIRHPASLCGVVGLKPSYSRVSRFGLLSMTSSTDVIGPLAKTPSDAATVLGVIAGADERDATSSPVALENYLTAVSSGQQVGAFKGLTVGWPEEYFPSSLNPEVLRLVKQAASRLEAAGARIKKISLPYSQYGIPVYYIITPSEISSNLARFDGVGWGSSSAAADLKSFYEQSRGAGFGPEVKRRIMLGTYALSSGYYDAYYKKAQAVRTLIVQDFDRAFKEVDIILTPTSFRPAFKIGEQVSDPLAMYMEDVFVTGASLAGLPAVSVPAGLVVNEEGQGLPIGAQITGPRWSEGLILKAANQIAV